MLKPLFPLSLLLLAGCASTQQAEVTPPANVPAAVAESTSTTAPTPAAVPTATPGLRVADVTPPPAAAMSPIQAANPGVSEPYQCMLAWARGMQDAMTPWAVTAQRCEPRTSQP